MVSVLIIHPPCLSSLFGKVYEWMERSFRVFPYINHAFFPHPFFMVILRVLTFFFSTLFSILARTSSDIVGMRKRRGRLLSSINQTCSLSSYIMMVFNYLSCPHVRHKLEEVKRGKEEEEREFPSPIHQSRFPSFFLIYWGCSLLILPFLGSFTT